MKLLIQFIFVDTIMAYLVHHTHSTILQHIDCVLYDHYYSLVMLISFYNLCDFRNYLDFILSMMHI